MVPAVVATCERDRLRAEGTRYADALAAVGALRDHLDLVGLDHAYNLSGSPRDKVEDAYRAIAAHVVAALA